MLVVLQCRERIGNTHTPASQMSVRSRPCQRVHVVCMDMLLASLRGSNDVERCSHLVSKAPRLLQKDRGMLIAHVGHRNAQHLSPKIIQMRFFEGFLIRKDRTVHMKVLQEIPLHGRR